MALYTLAEIKAEIVALKGAIAKSEEKQAVTSGGPGDGMHHQRGDLRAMYDRLAKLEALYERQAQLEGDSPMGYVSFARPR